MTLAKCLLSIRSTDDVSKLQSDANGADLLFNEAKFMHVHFWAKPSFDLDTATYTVNVQPIKQLSKHKELGIVFSCNLRAKHDNHHQSISDPRLDKTNI